MNIYLLNIFIVLLLYILDPKIHKDNIVKSYRNNNYTLITIIVIFITMFLEMGFRGDFYIDTIHYYIKFIDVGKENIANVLHGTKDVGYDVLNYYFYNLISNQYLYFLLFISFVVAASFSIFMLRESSIIWLSFLVLLCSGSFYTGFNIMKELLVVSLFSLLYYYIYTKQKVKYISIGLLLSTMHTSLLFILPIYFLPLVKWKKLNVKWVLLIFVAILLSAYQIMNVIVESVINRFFVHYERVGAFGMDEGISLQGTLKAVLLSLFVVLNLKKFNKNSAREMLIYNGCILYAFFAVCGYKIYMIQRLVHYFMPCLMIGYPIVISRIKYANRRRLVLVLIVTVLILSSINIILDPPYYFYWDNSSTRW